MLRIQSGVEFDALVDFISNSRNPIGKPVVVDKISGEPVKPQRYEGSAFSMFGLLPGEVARVRIKEGHQQPMETEVIEMHLIRDPESITESEKQHLQHYQDQRREALETNNQRSDWSTPTDTKEEVKKRSGERTTEKAKELSQLLKDSEINSSVSTEIEDQGTLRHAGEDITQKNLNFLAKRIR